MLENGRSRLRAVVSRDLDICSFKSDFAASWNLKLEVYVDVDVGCMCFCLTKCVMFFVLM